MSNKSSVDEDSASEIKAGFSNSFKVGKRKNKWRSQAKQQPKYVLTNLKNENKIKPIVMRELKGRNSSLMSQDHSRLRFLSELLEKRTYNNLLKVKDDHSSTFKLIELKDLKLGKPEQKQNIGSRIPLRFDSDNWEILTSAVLDAKSPEYQALYRETRLF